MKFRLIKPRMSAAEQKHELPPREVPIVDTIQAWVREFRSTRATRARLDFQRISNPVKR